MKHAPLVLGLAAILTAVAHPAATLETDQYYSWGRELGDSTDVINAKFNLELEHAVASFDAPPDQCMDIAIRFRKRVRFLLFHQIQIWAMNTSLVPRIPTDATEDVHYRNTNMYHVRGVFDPGMWMTFTPTIEVNGVRIGTDKLAHFVSSGWTYYKTYNRALKNGKSPIEAEYAAVRRGILEESLILGKATVGILSRADLEANYQGMHFYLDVCSVENPILAHGEDGWRIDRPVDLRDYVHPGWDESYRTSIFSVGRWRKVLQGLSQYCDRRTDPQVLEMHRRYAEIDRPTVAQEAIAETVAEGKLPDPEQFTLEAICPALDGGAAPDWTPGARASLTQTAVDPPPTAVELTEQIIALDRDIERRTIRIAALRLNYPLVVSGSYGWLFTRQPRDYDCRTPCDLWGTFAQIEPGLGGGKLSLGWGRVIGEQRRGPIALSSVYLAMGVKASVLQSWGSESPLPAGQTYAGAEFELSVARVNMGVGLMNRVSGDEGRDWVVTGYLGWGF